MRDYREYIVCAGEKKKMIIEEEDSNGGGDLYMDVEPIKTVPDWIQEWVDYFRGTRKESPSGVPIIIKEEKENEELRKKREADMWRLLELEVESAREQKKRRIDKEDERMRILNRARERVHLGYLGKDTKLERLMRFREIFLRPDGETVRGRIIEANDQYVEDPYDDEYKTWRDRQRLALVNIPKLEFIPKDGATAEDFFPLYNMTGYNNTTLETYSTPDIFLLDVVEENREKFKSILYGDSQVLMKVTPFVNKQGQIRGELDILQTYNEIKIAYFLSELLYGYTNVLSVHFMVVVDWFQTSRAKMGLYADPQNPTEMDNLYNQITISEYAHTTVGQFFYDNPTLGALRAFIFQVLHALETAWHTNEFVHHDLHLNNIMLKKTHFDEQPLSERNESPFDGRNLLYKRRHDADWYVLKKEDLGNHIVKIIDFGFSRIYAPSHEQHDLYSVSLSHPPHLHDRFIGLTWPQNGMDPLHPNRYTDVRMLFLSILILPATFWNALSSQERQVVYAISEEVLDFNLMNVLIDQLSFKDEVSRVRRYMTVGNRLTPENINSCQLCVDFLMKFGGYARGNTLQTTNWTATDVLSHPFFDALKRTPNYEGATTLQKANALRNDVVVSFIDQDSLRETQMLKIKPNLITLRSNNNSNSIPLACSICKNPAKLEVHLDGTVIPVCGALCAEFKCLYNSKTVFR